MSDSQEIRCWLIEHAHSGAWWDGRQFRNDPNLAIRFVRKMDAEMLMTTLPADIYGDPRDPGVKATEHLWFGDDFVRRS